MKDMFFMGFKGLASQNFSALREAATAKIAETGFVPEKLRSAAAVHDGCDEAAEKGVVVLLHDGDEKNFDLAFAVKENLRHGTYTVLLNESSLPNTSFMALAPFTPGRHLMQLANQWLDAARLIAESTGIFVSGFVYETPQGFLVVGNANPNMVGNVAKWQDAAGVLCQRLGLMAPEFYDNRPKVNSRAFVHHRIGYFGQDMGAFSQSIH